MNELTSINKYQNGKIYKIIDIAYTKTYYGSTVRPLSLRLAGHRASWKLYQSGKTKKCPTVFHLFDEFGIEHCKIELVETYPCGSKAELERREGYYIQNNECINKLVAGRTDKEYREATKDRIKERMALYREENREQLRAKKRESYQADLEQSRKYYNEYYHMNKEAIVNYRSEYRTKNIEKIREQERIRRELNKDRMKEYFRLKQQEYRAKCKNNPVERTTCEICGGVFRTDGRLRHERSLMHKTACETIK